MFVCIWCSYILVLTKPIQNCVYKYRAAVVLAFFSNEQTFQSVENLQVTLNNAAGDAVDYLTDTVEEVSDIVCQLTADGGVVNSVFDESTG